MGSNSEASSSDIGCSGDEQMSDFAATFGRGLSGDDEIDEGPLSRN